MVLSLWANEMFCRKSESANQLMLSINFFSEMSSNKILQQQQKKKNSLTIGSCFSVHYRVMEHAGSLESTKEA